MNLVFDDWSGTESGRGHGEGSCFFESIDGMGFELNGDGSGISEDGEGNGSGYWDGDGYGFGLCAGEGILGYRGDGLGCGDALGFGLYDGSGLCYQLLGRIYP